MNLAVISDWVYLLSSIVSALMFARLLSPVTGETCSIRSVMNSGYKRITISGLDAKIKL
jgi:hypothetical protein